MYKKTVLENGLTILTVPRHETKAVTVFDIGWYRL